MPDKVFGGIFDNGGAAVIAVPDFLICVGVSLVIGVFLALVYTYRSRYTKSFVITLAILPAVVCVVIMMVNGNVGAGGQERWSRRETWEVRTREEWSRRTSFGKVLIVPWREKLWGLT